MDKSVIKCVVVWVASCSLFSCDCIQRIQGYVVDAETNRPLQDVFYTRSRLTANEKQQLLQDTSGYFRPLTDSTGWFSSSLIANGFNCKPHMVLWLEKEGYAAVQMEWRRGQSNLDTVIMKLTKNPAAAAPYAY